MHARRRIIFSLLTAALSVVALQGPAQGRPTWDTSPVEIHRHDQLTHARVVDLQFGQHAHFDRLVVDFRRSSPADVWVRYVPQVTWHEGDPIPMHGKRFLALAFESARISRSLDEKPRIRHPHLAQLRDVALIGEFEGNVTLAVGLNHRARFRVFTLRSPLRLVIDVRHKA